jgi:serine/threonine protein kinase
MKTCPVCDTPYPDQRATCPTDGAVLIESRELEPDHVVRGKYRIVRKLGQGGMGVVYLAEHRMLGGQMALKFLATELSRNPQFVKRFRNEARAAYQLRHPNIVEVLDLDQDEDGSLFIAMEYVAGPSLRTVLREAKRPLPVRRALQIAQDIAAGLSAAHGRGAIHRDIKPENILLGSKADGGEQAKVLDFGIAAMTENITNLSRTHGLLLTPEYAAPEQWRGTPASELDGRTDLYALGGVLYEMLAGRTPFRAVNPEGWMFQHLQGVPEPIELLRPDLNREFPGLGSVVMRLLARDREQRFSSAAAFIDALSQKPAALRAAASVASTPIADPVPPVQVQPPSVKDRGTSTTRFRNIGWALAGLIVIGLGIWFVLNLFRSTPATAIPVLTPSGGTYSEARTVAISDATPHTIIHFTVNGNPPTKDSPTYTQPISSLPSGAVVRAMATADGHSPSLDVTGVYVWSGATQSSANSQGSGVYEQGKSSYDHKQFAQARTLFAQACDGGEMKACNYLGYLYAQGQGGAQDLPKAREVYQRACDKGTLSSCASIGVLYQDAGSSEEARKYFKMACDGGSAKGCGLLRGVQ